MKRRPVPAADGWMSFRYGLYRQISYRFDAVVIDPDDLETSSDKIIARYSPPFK